MNISLDTALYNSQGIDTNNVEAVTKQILQSSGGKQVTVQGLDYSKFNRATLGIDLYSSRTNTDIQKQIAMLQAGLYAKNIDTSSLNAIAAQALYAASASQNNPALVQATLGEELKQVPILEPSNNIYEINSTNDKNSHSANTYNPFTNTNEDEENQERDRV